MPVSILYVRLDETWADHDVIAIDANGKQQRSVVSDRDFFDYGAGTRFGYPRVSSDGEKVLFPSHRSGWINYWTVPLAGGEPRPMAPADADQHEAHWSPDGESIVYTENHDGQYDLRVVSSAGGEPRSRRLAGDGTRIEPRLVAGRPAHRVQDGYHHAAGGSLHRFAGERGRSTQATHRIDARRQFRRTPRGTRKGPLRKLGRLHHLRISLPPAPTSHLEPVPLVSSGSTAVPPASTETCSSPSVKVARATPSSSPSAATRCSTPISGEAPGTGKPLRTATTAAGATAISKTWWRVWST